MKAKKKRKKRYKDGKRKDREWDVNEGRERRAIARGGREKKGKEE